MNFANFPWSQSELFLYLMFLMLLDTKASGVVVCSTRTDDTKYWREWINHLGKKFDRPATCFGGHKKKLRDGVMIVYFFQSEWIDKFEYIKAK